MAHAGGESNARSKSVKIGNVLNPCSTSGSAPKFDCHVTEPSTNHFQRLRQIISYKRIERTIYFAQHHVTVGGVSGRSTWTTCPSTKRHQAFAQLLQSREPETEVSLSNDE